MLPVPMVRLTKRADTSAARDRRHDGDLLAALELGAQTLEEADVLVADVEVDEAAHALLVEEAVAHAGVALLEIFDDERPRWRRAP